MESSWEGGASRRGRRSPLEFPFRLRLIVAVLFAMVPFRLLTLLAGQPAESATEFSACGHRILGAVIGSQSKITSRHLQEIEPARSWAGRRQTARQRFPTTGRELPHQLLSTPARTGAAVPRVTNQQHVIDAGRCGSISCRPGRLQNQTTTGERYAPTRTGPRAARARRLRVTARRGGGGARRRRPQDTEDRCDLRPDRPVRRRRIGTALSRRQDDDRLLHLEGPDRRLHHPGRLRRRPEQARCGHQRSRPPDRAGKGGHAARLLLLGRVRARRGAHRGIQEVHVDHHLHRLARAARPPPALRVPSAALRQAMGPGLHRNGRRLRQGAARQGPEGHPRRHHPRGWPVRRRRRQGQRGRRQEGRTQRRAG